MYNKNKLNRIFSTECCSELTIESGSSRVKSQFAKYYGHYQFKFDKDNLNQIKKGFFVYKKGHQAKYIFKSQDGIWMVRRFNPSFNIFHWKSICNVGFEYNTIDWFQTKWYC